MPLCLVRIVLVLLLEAATGAELLWQVCALLTKVYKEQKWWSRWLGLVAGNGMHEFMLYISNGPSYTACAALVNANHTKSWEVSACYSYAVTDVIR